MRIGLTIPHRLHGAAIYGAPWIPSTKTPFMLAYIYIPAPWIRHGYCQFNITPISNDHFPIGTWENPVVQLTPTFPNFPSIHQWEGSSRNVREIATSAMKKHPLVTLVTSKQSWTASPVTVVVQSADGTCEGDDQKNQGASGETLVHCSWEVGTVMTTYTHIYIYILYCQKWG